MPVQLVEIKVKIIYNFFKLSKIGLIRNIFLSMFVLTTPLFSDVDIAIVKTLKGSAKIKRMYGLLPLKVGDFLEDGDVVMTDENSSIGIIFNDGTRVSLGAKSYIAIEKYIFDPPNNNFVFDLNMTKGKVLFESGEFGIKAPKKVKFRVPDGVIGIRGTKFYVEVK